MSEPTKLSKIRVSKRAHYDEDTIHAILDCGLVAHVGFVLDGRPMVIPMAYARNGSTLYIHGAKAARIIKKNKSVPACLTVTHIDGLVVARSAFHHSVNYRSVVVHGHLRDVTDQTEKEKALVLVTNHLLPDRWDEVRPMTDKEFKSTGVLALEIEAASAKIRSGPPVDDEEDYTLAIWAGVLECSQTLNGVIHDPRNIIDDIPASIEKARGRFNRAMQD